MRYVVTGRVQPERAAVSFGQVRGDLSGGHFTAMCDSSELCINIDTPEIQDVATAKIRAEECAHLVVSSLGFALGSSYGVEAVQVIDTEGRASVFGVRIQQLVFEDFQAVFNRAITLAGKDIFFA